MMKQLQFYKLALLLLVILNAFTLVFVFTKPRPSHIPPPHGKPPKEAIIKKFGLDAEQAAKFSGLAEQHRKQTEMIRSDQRSTLELYFNTLIDTTYSNTDSLIAQVQQLEGDKIRLTYEHFKEVKSLLNMNQESDFKQFMKGMMRIIIPPQKKHHPPPKDF